MVQDFLFDSFIKGRFIKRYKRFFADIVLDDGQIVTAHCPNSGRMTSCLEEGWPVLLTQSNNPKRKLPYTFEYIFNGKTWIGVNTHRANSIVEDAIKTNAITELDGHKHYRREVPYATSSRVDFLLDFSDYHYYLEVKSVTLLEDGWYQFPDAPSERGQKHLKDLMSMVSQGSRAGILFLVQRGDGDKFKPADTIDPTYALLMEDARQSGVDILIYTTVMTEYGLKLDYSLVD